MPAWIECRECGEEFRDKAGRTKCPECGSRIDLPDDFDDEPAPRRRPGKPKSRTLLFALLGVGGLAVAFTVVMILLLVSGPRADPSKVTVANFQRLNLGMVQGDAEKILAGSSSSSFSDMQTELTNAFGQQGWMAGLFAQFSALGGSGSWRRWDGPSSHLKVWAHFTEPFGGGKEQLTFCTAIETLPGGGYRHHPGKQALGGIFGGFPFPGGQPFPPIQFPK